MKYYSHNGINFVTDLIWQVRSSNEKFALNNYFKDCKFDFYCRSTQFKNIYGFGRYPTDGTQKESFLKLKTTKSLALHIVDSLSEIETTDSSIVCFCFDKQAPNPLYGYVFVYQGVISPEGGEFLGSLDELRENMKQLTNRYSIDAVFIPDDIPFFNNSAFEYELGVKFNILYSDDDNMSASEYLFFNQRRYYGTIRKLDRSKEKKLAIIFVIIMMILLVAYFVADYYIEDESENLDLVPDVAKELVVKSYPAQMFINHCLKDFDKYIVNNGHWQTKSFKCTTDAIEVDYYATYTGDNSDLQALLNHQVVIKSDSEAELKEKILFPHYTAVSDAVSRDEKSEALEKASRLLDMKTNINGNSFEISSGYSPVFLYQNKIINNLYLSEVAMTLNNDTGFMDWKIVGEINAK